MFGTVTSGRLTLYFFRIIFQGSDLIQIKPINLFNDM